MIAQCEFAHQAQVLATGEHHPTDYLAERVDKEDRIAKQLGTLGGGNHFLEVVYAEGDEQASGLRAWV